MFDEIRGSICTREHINGHYGLVDDSLSIDDRITAEVQGEPIDLRVRELLACDRIVAAIYGLPNRRQTWRNLHVNQEVTLQRLQIASIAMASR